MPAWAGEWLLGESLVFPGPHRSEIGTLGRVALDGYLMGTGCITETHVRSVEFKRRLSRRRGDGSSQTIARLVPFLAAGLDLPGGLRAMLPHLQPHLPYLTYTVSINRTYLSSVYQQHSRRRYTRDVAPGTSKAMC